MNIKKRINLALVSLLAVVGFIGLFNIQAVGAQTSAKDAVCESLGAVDGNDDCSDGGANINGVLETVLNILSIVAGVIAVIMIIIAGIKFITSQGDASSVASARQSVIYAIVGVVIVVMSQVIVRFVLTESADLVTPEEDESSLARPIA